MSSLAGSPGACRAGAATANRRPMAAGLAGDRHHAMSAMRWSAAQHLVLRSRRLLVPNLPASHILRLSALGYLVTEGSRCPLPQPIRPFRRRLPRAYEERLRLRTPFLCRRWPLRCTAAAADANLARFAFRSEAEHPPRVPSNCSSRLGCSDTIPNSQAACRTSLRGLVQRRFIGHRCATTR